MLTEPKRVSEQTRLEQERGRTIAQRAQRERDLNRYISGGKVQVEREIPSNTLFFVAGVQIASQSILDDDYPSEGVMAIIGMAVNATVGTDGIPPVMDDSPEAMAERARRNSYRDKYLGQWRNGREV